MKTNITENIKSLLTNKAFAVIRLNESNKALPVVDALIKGGVKNIEITLTSENPYKVIENVANEFASVAEIGVGSVLNINMLKNSVNAGATYVVTPIFKKELIELCHSYKYPIFVGAYSPTEIYGATEAGADIIKVFPANIVGMKYFKAIKAPMPDLKIMPTGGVTLSNANEWFKVGACAVGIGGALVENQAIKQSNFKKLTENGQKLMDTINEYFSNKD